MLCPCSLQPIVMHHVSLVDNGRAFQSLIEGQVTDYDTCILSTA